MVTWPFVASLLKLKPFASLISTKTFLVEFHKHISFTELQWLQTFIGDVVGYSKYCEMPTNFVVGWTTPVQDFFHQQLRVLKKTVNHQHWPPTNPLEPSSKTLMTFHCTDWFKGILTMDYHKPQMIGAQNPLLNITHIYRCTGSCQNTVTVEYEG